MKALVKILVVCMVVSLIAGCGTPAPTQVPTKPPAAGPTTPPTPVPEPTLTADQAWLKAAELGPYAPAKQDWAAIEAAAKKEGKVLVYANSSRIETAAAEFMKLYPEIKVANAQICAFTQDEAAQHLKVSRRTVQHARAVLDHEIGRAHV